MTDPRFISQSYGSVTPQLHGELLDPDGTVAWDEYHDALIQIAAEVFESQISHLGYTTSTSGGLQVRPGIPDNSPFLPSSQDPAIPRASTIHPDIGIRRPSSPTSIPTLARRDSEQAVSLKELLNVASDDYYRGIQIWETKDLRNPNAVPIAWIEVPSPGNKPGTGSREKVAQYQRNRKAVINHGIPFAEYDILHETPALIPPPYVPPYNTPSGPEPGSSPFRMTVLDPRGAGSGLVFPKVYPFHMDEPLPSEDDDRQLWIPLLGNHGFRPDWEQANQLAFERRFALKVDQTRLPRRLDRYDLQTQQQIAARTANTILGLRDGRIDETQRGPIPLHPALRLDKAFEQLALIQQGHDLVPPSRDIDLEL